MPEYQDFEIIVQAKDSAGTYSVFANGPAGQDSGEMVLSEKHQQDISRLEEMRMTSGQEEGLKSIGRVFFDLLFPDPIQRLYERSRDGRRLRLKLILEPPELRSLHWEYLYDYHHETFPALSSSTALVRHVPLPEIVKPVTVEGPLRILVLIAAPSDMIALDVAGEKALIQQELAGLIQSGRVEIDIAEGEQVTRCTRTGTESLPYGRRIATPAGLQDLLREDYHAFHYIGHGEFDETSHSGLLALEDETTGRKHLMSADTLRVLFHDASIKLAVLNGCETGSSSEKGPFLGVAPALVKAGVPAVVAMQFPIADQTAITFARNFYAALADDFPVDAAIAESRKAIFAKFPTRRDWGIPVLFMRSPDGVLWKMDNAPAPVTPKSPESHAEEGNNTTEVPSLKTPEYNVLGKEEGNMPESHDLHSRLIAFFTSIPNIRAAQTQDALITNAELDSPLVNLLPQSCNPSVFFPLLLSTIKQYGRLEDGTDPVVALLTRGINGLLGSKWKKDEREALIRILQGGKGSIHAAGNAQQPSPSQEDINNQTGGMIVNNNYTIGNGATLKGVNFGNGNQNAVDVDAGGDFVQNMGGNVEIHKNASPPAETKEDMLKVLKQMQELIAGLDIEDRRSKKTLDRELEDAVLEIEDPENGKEPNKETVAGHLQKAGETLKAAENTANQAVAFGKLVAQAATWLGPAAAVALKIFGM